MNLYVKVLRTVTNKSSMYLNSSLHTTSLPNSVVQQILSICGSWDTSINQTNQNTCHCGVYIQVEGNRQNKISSIKDGGKGE